MTRRDVQELIARAGDTRTVVIAEMALRSYCAAHPGEKIGDSECLYMLKTAMQRIGKWDEEVARTVREQAGAPDLAKSA